MEKEPKLGSEGKTKGEERIELTEAMNRKQFQVEEYQLDLKSGIEGLRHSLSKIEELCDDTHQIYGTYLEAKEAISKLQETQRLLTEYTKLYDELAELTSKF